MRTLCSLPPHCGGGDAGAPCRIRCDIRSCYGRCCLDLYGPDTALRMLFVTLGTFVQLSSEVAVLGHLAVGTAGNSRRSGCQEVGVFCASVCHDDGVFCVFSTLFFFDSHCVVLDMMRIDGRAARGSRRPLWWLVQWHKHLQ